MFALGFGVKPGTLADGARTFTGDSYAGAYFGSSYAEGQADPQLSLAEGDGGIECADAQELLGVDRLANEKLLTDFLPHLLWRLSRLGSDSGDTEFREILERLVYGRPSRLETAHAHDIQADLRKHANEVRPQWDRLTKMEQQVREYPDEFQGTSELWLRGAGFQVHQGPPFPIKLLIPETCARAETHANGKVCFMEVEPGDRQLKVVLGEPTEECRFVVLLTSTTHTRSGVQASPHSAAGMAHSVILICLHKEDQDELSSMIREHTADNDGSDSESDAVEHKVNIKACWKSQDSDGPENTQAEITVADFDFAARNMKEFASRLFSDFNSMYEFISPASATITLSVAGSGNTAETAGFDVAEASLSMQTVAFFIFERLKIDILKLDGDLELNVEIVAAQDKESPEPVAVPAPKEHPQQQQVAMRLLKRIQCILANNDVSEYPCQLENFDSVKWRILVPTMKTLKVQTEKRAMEYEFAQDGDVEFYSASERAKSDNFKVRESSAMPSPWTERGGTHACTDVPSRIAHCA
jgi:hypothetical protein